MKACAIANANEHEEFSWEDVEIEDKNIDSASIFEQESESTEESTYLIENGTGQTLTSCETFLSVKEESKLDYLGVCYAHFIFDQSHIKRYELSKKVGFIIAVVYFTISVF
ncbi:8364_t:CDS:2 [Ambispora gerdemannii]|uniref:8364_t:CDS:1 n=1 Tax=Ambispora gerdemannii TaxID=144530 RepID=A0A9N9CLZ3_9GLOM|nr:8364_t:CDS:2 [Ambispora gerdemannii]